MGFEKARISWTERPLRVGCCQRLPETEWQQSVLNGLCKAKSWTAAVAELPPPIDTLPVPSIIGHPNSLSRNPLRALLEYPEVLEVIVGRRLPITDTTRNVAPLIRMSQIDAPNEAT
jgi:hypothetical protein